MAFISELNPTATGLLYSTFLGGTDDPFYGNPLIGSGALGIALTPAGNILVSGETLSPDFPVTSTTLGKCGGAFISELNPSVTPADQLLYSTCFGNLEDVPLVATGVLVASDSSGDIYFAGGTVDPSLPVTSNAYQSQCLQFKTSRRRRSSEC